MWTKEVSIKTKASKSSIWKLWADVPQWNRWDDQVVDSSLDGAFEKGQKGLLTPKAGPKSKFEIIELTAEQSFTSRSRLPLSKMDFVHTMKEQDGVLVITHKLEISGLLSSVFGKLIGSKIVNELPQALQKLDEMAQTEER